MSQKIQTISMRQKVANIRILCIEAIAVVVRIMLNTALYSINEDRKTCGIAIRIIFIRVLIETSIDNVAETPAFWHQFSL